MSNNNQTQIPDPQGIDPAIAKVLIPMRDIINRSTGRNGNTLQPVPTTASLGEFITAFNNFLEQHQS